MLSNSVCDGYFYPNLILEGNARSLVSYSQHFIFYGTPKNWSVLSLKVGKLAGDKRSSLLGPFVSYKENEA
jgi:hypothetical protein